VHVKLACLVFVVIVPLFLIVIILSSSFEIRYHHHQSGSKVVTILVDSAVGFDFRDRDKDRPSACVFVVMLS
jgi:hypothetical protein